MAPSTTNYVEIQRDEIDALKSIYGDAFVEKQAKIGPWKKAADRAFQIELKRDVSAEKQDAVLLHVNLPTTYPRTLPDLRLECGSGVRLEKRVAAEDVIRALPPSLLGSEMIFDITSALQEILDQNDQEHSKYVPALIEERNAKEEAMRQEAEALEAQRTEEALKLAKAQAAMDEHEAIVQLAERQQARSERRSVITAGRSDEINVEKIPGGQAFERPSVRFQDPTGAYVTVNAVFNKAQFRHTRICKLFIVQVDQFSNAQTNDAFLMLKQYSLKDESVHLRQDLHHVETVLDRLMHLAGHPSTLPLLNYRIERSDPEASTDPPAWTVSILTAFTPRGTMRDVMTLTETLDSRRVKAWSIQLLEGLHYLHRHGIVHGHVHLGNVLMWEGEAVSATVKWSDAAYASLLGKLAANSSPTFPKGWWPSDYENNSTQEPRTDNDIWCFAICLAQAAFGLEICQQYDTPKAFLDGHSISQSFRHVLHAVFTSDTNRRPSAWDLLHFEVFRNNEGFSDSVVEGTMSKVRTRRESEAPAEPSEYARKFIEEGRLGKGGFGEVFRARNRTDGQLYAVKKIRAASRRALDPVLSETTVLSRLNHPNVVRYFTSWIEESSNTAVSRNDDFGLSHTSESLSLNRLSLTPAVLTSSRGLDFVSSNDIVFGDPDDHEQSGSEYGESDSEASESSIGENQAVQSIGTRRDSLPSEDVSTSLADGDSFGASLQRTSTTLYIQMEFCKQETLRNLINGGLQSNPPEIWRLFRQIVRGLAHIHASSIVHRDLKPENIFVDDGGDLRIGDFGLARPGEQIATLRSTKASKHGASFTKDIGTAWYVAPEVRSVSAFQYSEKADLYSLGIVFLEMNVTFSTGMERAETLERLAQRDHSLPTQFSHANMATQSRILLSLLQYDPSQRPSCIELLDDMPVEGDSQASQLLRRELRDERSHLRSEMLQMLFEPSEKGPKSQESSKAFEVKQKLRLVDGVAAMSKHVPDMELQSKIKYELTKIFRRHGGAERTDSPAVFPKHPFYATSEVIQFLDSSGNLLQLPYDLILPNAMVLCNSDRFETKTFAFGDVYRPDPRKEEPNIYGEVDFDITSQNSRNIALQESEIIKVVDEIVDRFPSWANTTVCYHFNHSDLLNTIFDHCNIDVEKRFAANEILSKLNYGHWTWPKIRHELRSPPVSLSSTSLDELERFDWRDPLSQAAARMRTTLGTIAAVENALVHLSQVLSLLHKFGVHRQIYLSPLSTYNEKFYRGHMFFQCIFDRKRRAVLAAGGRYDCLVADHQILTQREPTLHAVGFQMAWSGLCSGMLTYLSAPDKGKGKRRIISDKSEWVTRRCDVLVDCYDQKLFDGVGARIVSDMWAHHISAELADTDDAGTSSNFAKASPMREEHKWTILLKSGELAKVRNAARQDESEVRVADLVPHIRSELRERQRNEGRHISAPLIRMESQPERATEIHDPDVKVLISLTKSKKSNRKAIVEEAIAHAQTWRLSSKDDPIIAIETKDENFRNLQNTSLGDPDTWKRFIQAAPVGDRAYLAQLQSMLQELQGKKAAFLYNFRSKAILHYGLFQH